MQNEMDCLYHCNDLENKHDFEQVFYSSKYIRIRV